MELSIKKSLSNKNLTKHPMKGNAVLQVRVLN